MYEKQIEKIPGFEKTPEINIVKDVQIICKMAKIKLPIMEDNFFENGEAIKKLLDDRRQLFIVLKAIMNCKRTESLPVNIVRKAMNLIIELENRNIN